MASSVPTADILFPAGASVNGHYVGSDVAAAIAAKRADPLSVLLARPESPTPEALEFALREFGELAGPDLMRRATLRGAAIEALKARKVASPAAVVNTALGTVAAETEAASGTAQKLPEPEP